MRTNMTTRIVGRNVVLVPYRKCHVHKYHCWMQSGQLRQQTASEELSIDEEYKMQQTWLEDADKCTFIILQRQNGDKPMRKDQEGRDQEERLSQDILNQERLGQDILDQETLDQDAVDLQELNTMVGDVNLFLNDADNRSSAELEVMIADDSCRGQGLGKEAVLAMMCYGVKKLGLTEFTVKIGEENQTSLNLFSKLSFVEMSRSEVFKEITMSLFVTDSLRASLETQTAHILIETIFRTLS